MVAVARAELKPFAEVEVPRMRGPVTEYFLGMMVLMIYIFRPVLTCVRIPNKFYHQLTQMGNVDRLALLLWIANFDEHRDGVISEAERKEFDKRAEKICADFVASLPNLTVAGSIIIGATHMHSMGRPAPWQFETDFAEEYGSGGAKALVWLAYGMNVFVEILAVTVMVVSRPAPSNLHPASPTASPPAASRRPCSGSNRSRSHAASWWLRHASRCLAQNAYWFRLIVTLYTRSTAERLCFMLRSNAIGLIANLTAVLFFSILLLVGLAGLLNQGSEGWLAMMAPPLAMMMCTASLAPAILSSHRRMHAEARRVLSHSLTKRVRRASHTAVAVARLARPSLDSLTGAAAGDTGGRA